MVKARRSLAKAISWRAVGTLDTLILSYLLITHLGPLFGLESSSGEALEDAGFIAITEVATKTMLYFLHERAWAALAWGVSIAGFESYRRSATKTACWRTIASFDTFLLAWIYTGSVGTAASIGGFEVGTKLVLYFIHERAWSRLPFGIAVHPRAGFVPPSARNLQLAEPDRSTLG